MQNKAGQKLTEFCQDNALSSSSWRWRSSIQSAKTRPRTDCGSNPELLITKFRLKLKNVRKTTRLFSHDLNQNPYDYTVKVTDRFKWLYLIDSVPEELWMEVPTLYRLSDQNYPQEKKRKRVKWLSEEDLQRSEKRREKKGKGVKERYTNLNIVSTNSLKR